ncbi:MAG: hypothetical protein HQ564_08395 [Candidatus Saganbacteria bacterium]|nr:hypothetical protein [Candidatus Saganbacteria bacterium]
MITNIRRFQSCMRWFAAPRNAPPVITPKKLTETVSRYDQLNELKPRDVVIVRGDLDSQGDGNLDTEKLRSNIPLLKYLTEVKKCNVVLIGHKRRPDNKAFAAYEAGGRDVDPLYLFHHKNQEDKSTLRFLEGELGQHIDHLPYWLEPRRFALDSLFTAWVRKASANATGKICLIGNDRLIPDLYNNFNAAAEEAAEGMPYPLQNIGRSYFNLGEQIQELGIKAYIYEAASASKEGCGSKSALAPFVPYVALGPSMIEQMEAIQKVLGADVYSISGSKAKQKVVDALTLVAKGKVEHVWTGGIVGLALAFGAAVFKGVISNDPRLLGAYSNPDDKNFIPPKMIETILAGLLKIEKERRLDRLHIPVDFESEQKGRILSFQPGGLQFGSAEHQFDIGPQTRKQMIEFFLGYPVVRGQTRLVASGFPGWAEAGHDAGLSTLRYGGTQFQERGGVLIGVGGEGRKVFDKSEFPNAIGIIPGGVTNVIACGETPAALRVLSRDLYPEG